MSSTNSNRENTGKLAGYIGIAGNVFLCGIKLAAGFLSGSISVIADAVNNLADAMSSVITVISFKLSGKPADEDHPYGHERIEYVATLLLSFLILFIGYELIKSSFSRIINPIAPELSVFTTAILLVSVIGKFAMSRMYMHYARKIDSTVLKASAQDSINDVFSTLAVLVASVLSVVFGVSLDGYAGLGVSLFIIYSGISLIKEGMNPILGSSPDVSLVQGVADKIMSYDGIIGIHDLIVHSYGPSRLFASVHAEVDAKGDILESHDLIDNIERDVASQMGIELVIHMDPIVTDDEDVVEAGRKIQEILKSIDNSLTMHDFRMVPGSTHTNIIFDVVVPFGFCHKESYITEYIQSKVFERMGSDYFCVINYDRDYTGKH